MIQMPSLYTASKTFLKYSTFDLIIAQKDGYHTRNVIHEIKSHAMFGISIAVNDTLNLDITLLESTQLCISSKCEFVLG